MLFPSSLCPVLGADGPRLRPAWIWIAQKRGSWNDFPFPSPSYRSDLDLVCSGSRTGTETLAQLQCEKCLQWWMRVPQLSHGCPALQGLSSWPH